MKRIKGDMLIVNIILLLALMTTTLGWIATAKPPTSTEQEQKCLIKVAELRAVVTAFNQRTKGIKDELEDTKVYIEEKKWQTWAETLPQEFPNVSTFRAWVNQQSLTTRDMGSWETAKGLQAQALDKGYLLNYQLNKNNVSSFIEFWVVAPIGDEIWLIDPIDPTGKGIKKYYPPSASWSY